MDDDIPYTTPDEDPFNVRPVQHQQQPRRRRSSLLNKWIKDQHSLPIPNAPLLLNQSHPTRSNPYLAYPDLASTVLAETHASLVTLNSYDFVEDLDIPLDHDYETPSGTPLRTPKPPRHPSAFLNFNLSFRASTSSMPRPQSPTSSSPKPSRLSFLSRSPRSSSHQHQRSSSLSTLNLSGQAPSDTPQSLYKQRPSVLGHFSSTLSVQSVVAPADTLLAPPRPSISSADTYSSTAPTVHNDMHLSPSKLSLFQSIRSRGKPGSLFGSGVANSSSTSIPSTSQFTSTSNVKLNDPLRLQTGPSSASSSTLQGSSVTRQPLAPKPKSRLASSNLEYDDLDEDEEEEEQKQMGTFKGPLSSKPEPTLTRPQVAYLSGSHPRVKFSSLSSRNRKKKKKLVVSGVGVNDVRKFEGVKRWCESFGEVSQINRMPNGDLHVHFRKAEVADTVCRIRAKVNIAGVGSVQLSWYTGDKR